MASDLTGPSICSRFPFIGNESTLICAHKTSGNKFDNFTRAVSPFLFNVTDARDIWARIECPTLLVRGTESWASDPAVDGRGAAFRHARVVNVAGAGHWVHHDRLDEFVALLREFLPSGTSPTSVAPVDG